MSLPTLPHPSVRNAVPATLLTVAAVLGFCPAAVAIPHYDGLTTANVSSAEPGDTILVGATGVTYANSPYRLRLSRSQVNCLQATLLLGGTVNSNADKNIPPTPRVLPTNLSSGLRWLCWAKVGDEIMSSQPIPLTVV